MSLVEDNDAIQAFLSQSADAAFDVRVQMGRAGRQSQHVYALCLQDPVSLPGELALPVPQKETRSLLAVRAQIAKLLPHPLAIRGLRHVPEPNPAAAHFQHQQNVVGPQGGGGDCKEVRRPDKIPVVCEECRPTQAAAAALWSGRQPVLFQDPPDSAPPEAAEAQLPHLPSDFRVAHAGVLPGNAQHQPLRLLGDRRPTGVVPGLEGPVPPHNLPVPAHDRIWPNYQDSLPEPPLRQAEAGQHQGQPLRPRERRPLAGAPLGNQ